MKTKTRKLISLFLALLMLGGTVTVPVYAADDADGTEAKSTKKTIAEISDILDAITYAEYDEKNAEKPRATKEVTINAADYKAEETTAKVEVYSNYEGSTGKSLYIGDSGKVTWDVQIPETGRYAIEIEYYQVVGKANSIERMFYINGKVPFSEARYLAMTKTWINNYAENGRFDLDFNGNELRPTTVEAPVWRTYTFIDSNGYYSNPFEFYFEKGANTISLEAVREAVIIKDIRLFPYEDKPTYEEVQSEYAAKGYTAANAEAIKIDAELPIAVSHKTIYPIYDRTSAITEPQDSALIRLNTIGSEKWQNAGQWVRYSFTPEASGLYEIVPRFKQSDLGGLFVTRRVLIDGEVPFEEANALRFEYDTEWQAAALNDGNTSFQFYFEAGRTYTIDFEITLGAMGDVIRQVNESLQNINKCYLTILKLTGANPDSYRDYGFSRVMPDTIETMLLEARNLDDVMNYLIDLNGVKGENIATLEQIAILLDKMATDEDEIARNLKNLKSYIGSLGTWVNTVKKQPLEFDYISIQPAGSEMPKATANFFEAIGYGIGQFVASFFTDYNSLSAETGEEGTSIDVWVVTGRDQAQSIRNLIDNNFTPQSNVNVNLKLVAAGTLLPSVLAGVGPDVSLSEADPINYAIRGAVLALNEFDTFEEVKSRFAPAAFVPITLYGQTYALPETQNFPVLFYRQDILADLGLEIPETWDDLLAMIPVLQYNNMEIGLLNDYNIYLYQMGGELYADDGMRINLDSNIALEAFEKMCNMFTQYSLPYQYDFANRFRTGEMPVAIRYYTDYLQLTVFATEIAGLWEFVPLPGTEDENGNINNCSVSVVSSIVMMAGTDNAEAAWDFMDWYVDKDFQSDYANEIVAILGEAGMHATANLEALAELPWTASQYENLMAQFNNLAAVPNYPGNYIIGRYTGFAFLAAYNTLADPVDSLLGYINTINKEITRKREEFGLETLELGQTLAEKRAAEAGEVAEDSAE